MNEEIERFYPQLGQALFDVLPDGFVEAWLGTEMLDDVWSIGLFFLSADGKTYFEDEDEKLDQLEGLLLEMRHAFKAASLPPFSTATFRLAATGRFSIDFGYEDVSDFGLGNDRREVWMKKYLNPDSQIVWG